MAGLKGRLEAYLVLGCNGYIGMNNFLFCPGTENPIINLNDLSDEQYLEVLDFLENACDLFVTHMSDYNKCVNAASILYRTYQAYDKVMLQNIQSFIKKHKECGLWLMLVLKEDLKRSSNE